MVAPAGERGAKEDAMLIECDSCVMQHTSACDDCIVTVLLAGRLDGSGGAEWGPGRVELDAGEADALRNLADAGLVAPLRLVVRHETGDEAEGSEQTPGSEQALG